MVDLVESRMKYIEEIFQKFNVECDIKDSPRDFKNFVVWDCQKLLKKLSTE